MPIAMSSRKRILRFLVLSAAVHLSIVVLIVDSLRHSRGQVSEHPTRYYATTLHIAGGIRAPWTPALPGRKRKPNVVSKRASDLAMSAQRALAAGQPQASPTSGGAGNGSDQDNSDPAFPVFSPRPPVVDRSLLPSSNREVVVDVKVSAQGDVLEATLVKGIGNGLDQIVLNTVKTWRFHPATIAGSPVASEAELIFPFNLNYPTTSS
jgi:TonB family protein